MKKTLIGILMFAGLMCANAQTYMGIIKLNDPNLDRGSSITKSLSERKSTRAFSAQKLSEQDLADLLWAANGVNRPDGKRTAPSAMNRQDITLYVCLEDGTYLYNPKAHALDLVQSGDFRPDGTICLILVSEGNESWSAMDAGIVSQNISLFCAGVGLATYPKGSMDREALREALKLNETQNLQLCHPVGHFE